MEGGAIAPVRSTEGEGPSPEWTDGGTPARPKSTKNLELVALAQRQCIYLQKQKDEKKAEPMDPGYLAPAGFVPSIE